MSGHSWDKKKKKNNVDDSRFGVEDGSLRYLCVETDRGILNEYVESRVSESPDEKDGDAQKSVGLCKGIMHDGEDGGFGGGAG